MSTEPIDSFLPSGGLETNVSTHTNGHHDLLLSPPGLVPRSVPDYVPVPGNYLTSRPCASTHSPKAGHHNHAPTHGPFSPPISRSTSTDDDTAALIEDWRRYTHNLREQFRGERAHLVADRVRADEVMAEGQELWERERALLKAQIAELQDRLDSCTCAASRPLDSVDGSVIRSPSHHRPLRSVPMQANHTSKAPTGSHSADHGAMRSVVQESGRNADGSPFYAPAPSNPSRSFAPNQAVDMRIDNMLAPHETPFRVTSKELTQNDFGIGSPTALDMSHEGSVVGDSIDISCIQPELDGVAIKASAVDPTFAAKVFSPNTALSPSRLSPHRITSPPLQDSTNHRGLLVRHGSDSKRTTLEVIAAPENHRLTMNAGHTPNHSVHALDFRDSKGSSNATPTQQQHASLDFRAPEVQQAVDAILDEDPALRGPLGLENDGPKDELFLSALTSKLQEIKEQRSPSETSSVSSDTNHWSEHQKGAALHRGRAGSDEHALMSVTEEDEEGDEIPVRKLRIKTSTNFGKPFGRI